MAYIRLKIGNFGRFMSELFEKLKFVHIKREFNQIADRLVNQALDDYLTNA